MLVGYEGRIINGQPALSETVVLPENTKIIVMVEMPAKKAESNLQSKEERIEKRREMLKSISGIITTDVDLEAMRAERIARRGLME